MMRLIVSGVFVLGSICATTSLHGQNQIANLFKVKDHDFGVVARGAKRDYSFTFTNTLNTPIQFTNASRSCGCVTPIIKTQLVNPGEKGEIVAQFNTLSFTGSRRATITLNVSKPQYTQVQLHIRGYVRTDVVVSPNFADFNNVVAGQATERVLKLSYAGSPIWKIVDVRSANPNIKTEFTETQRSGGRINYDVKILLKENSPWGFLNDQVVIVTNDNQKRELPILVSGNLKAPIEFPTVVNLGTVTQGSEITRTLMFKSKNAFTVTGIETANPRIQFSSPDAKNKFHMLKIEVDTTETGTLNDTVTIKTDVPNMPSAQVRLVGNVVEK